MIALVDCNNFYASCERIFRPNLENKPVIVLSNNDGCIIARSNEAKSFGFKMGEPIFKKRHMVEKYKVNLFSSNFALYGDISKRVFDVISKNIISYEIYSIDEAFLDFTNFLNPYQKALKLREDIRKHVGITISIGISYTKTLSKIAGYLAKKSKKGICFLHNKEDINSTLKSLPIDEIWGVGVRNAMKLKKYDIHTASDLIECDENWIRKTLNIVGLRMVRELKGIPHFGLESKKERKKSICTSRSFSLEVRDYMRMSEYVSMFSSRCSEKLRMENGYAKSVSVFMYTNMFKPREKQYSGYMSMNFDTATSDSIRITKLALQCVKKIYRDGYLYKKAGVVLSGIISKNQIQLNLFDSHDRIRGNNLMKTLDFINGNIGRNILRLGSSGLHNEWKIGKERLSPCYTTKWSDILQVRL